VSKAKDWQKEWQEGMERPEKAGVCACRQVVLIGELATSECAASKMAQWIVDHTPRDFCDHACEECIPGGEVVVEGFRCAVHEARALLADEEEQRIIAGGTEALP
jgi:hypothetical protein